MKVAQVCGNFPPELRGGVEMVVAALGVVFGDIGTSPLYAFRVALGAAAAGRPLADHTQ